MVGDAGSDKFMRLSSFKKLILLFKNAWHPNLELLNLSDSTTLIANLERLRNQSGFFDKKLITFKLQAIIVNAC